MWELSGLFLPGQMQMQPWVYICLEMHLFRPRSAPSPAAAASLAQEGPQSHRHEGLARPLCGAADSRERAGPGEGLWVWGPGSIPSPPEFPCTPATEPTGPETVRRGGR